MKKRRIAGRHAQTIPLFSSIMVQFETATLSQVGSVARVPWRRKNKRTMDRMQVLHQPVSQKGLGPFGGEAGDLQETHAKERSNQQLLSASKL